MSTQKDEEAPGRKVGRLRVRREALGISRRALAKELDVSHAAVRDYELAEVTEAISVKTFRRVAKALGCELAISLVPISPRRAKSQVEATARGPRLPAGPANAPSPGAPDPDELAQHLK